MVDARQELIGQILDKVAKNQMPVTQALETIKALFDQAEKWSSEAGPSVSELEEKIRALATRAKRLA